MVKEVAIFGMGCFWKPQRLFDDILGVKKTEVGYMGGQEGKKSYSYEEVCSGKTGHAEVIKVEFDNKKVSYSDLLEVFWGNHNPTTKNRQGFDFGKQYRSVIFYTNETQKKLAQKTKKEKQKTFVKKIVTEIKKSGKFYKAEDYHQKYLEKNRAAVC